MAGRAASGKSKRSRISAEARQKGAVSKVQHGIFNRYIRAIRGASAEKNRRKIAEIDEMLTRGTRTKKAPLFEDGKRIGTVEKELPLLPSERAIWLARRARLEESLVRSAPEDLRRQFLEMLPEYAARHELSRAILLEVGVPASDLDAAGIQK